MLAGWPVDPGRFRPVAERDFKFCASPETAKWSCPLTPLGEKVLACWRRIPEFWPQVSLIDAVVMPDHFHGILFVREALPPYGASADARRKSLGDIIRGFKTGCREVGWEEGFVDTILFRKGQLARMVAYQGDNPRRLGIKLAYPDLFKVVRDLVLLFAGNGEEPSVPTWHGPATGHFCALGNHFLLDRPELHQIQCSRSLFTYKREHLPGGWRICRDAAGVPIAETTTDGFEEKADVALGAAAHGAVLVSPCISHGEREIARRAFVAGYRVVLLRYKGFPPLYKPAGKLFDACADGRLLMLAPIGYASAAPSHPDTPTREQAQVLNRIAQLLSGEGAVTIDYKGAVMRDVDGATANAMRGQE